MDKKNSVTVAEGKFLVIMPNILLVKGYLYVVVKLNVIFFHFITKNGDYSKGKANVEKTVWNCNKNKDFLGT